MTFAISIAVVTAGMWGAFHAQPAYAWTDTLTVVKKVVGGTASADDFTIHVKQSGAEANGSPKVASTSGVSFSLEAATYVVSETGGPAGYTATFSGACNASGAVTLVLDQSHTCTITNTFQGGTPTPTGTPGSTSTPTATPTAIVNTIPSPTPTATPTATPTGTPTSTPTATPTAIVNTVGTPTPVATPGTNPTPSPTPGLPVIEVTPPPTTSVPPATPGTPQPPFTIGGQPPVGAPPTQTFGVPPRIVQPPLPAPTGNAGLGRSTQSMGLAVIALGMLAVALGAARAVTVRRN